MGITLRTPYFKGFNADQIRQEFNLIGKLFQHGWSAMTQHGERKIGLNSQLLSQFMLTTVSAPDSLLNAALIEASAERDKLLPSLYCNQYGPITHMHPYDHTAPYALGIFLTQLFAMAFDAKLNIDVVNIPMRTASVTGHLFANAKKLVSKFTIQTLLTIPIDNKGQAYAFNPMLRFGRTEYLDMLANPDFNWVAFYEEQIQHFMTQLQSGEVPLAHADYHHPDVRNIFTLGAMIGPERVSCDFCQFPMHITHANMDNGTIEWGVAHPEKCASKKSVIDQHIEFISGKVILRKGQPHPSFTKTLNKAFTPQFAYNTEASQFVELMQETAAINTGILIGDCINKVYVINVHDRGLLIFHGETSPANLPEGVSIVGRLDESHSFIMLSDLYQYRKLAELNQEQTPWYTFSSTEEKSIQNYENKLCSAPQFNQKTRVTSDFENNIPVTIQLPPGTYRYNVFTIGSRSDGSRTIQSKIADRTFQDIVDRLDGDLTPIASLIRL